MQHYGKRQQKPKVTIEYRLAVDKGYGGPRYTTKKTAALAEKGLADALRDFKRYGTPSYQMVAWLETRTVTTTEWEKM